MSGRTSVWDDVVGQPSAVAALQRAAANPVHAYLLVGPPGSTKDQAARGFAAALLNGGIDDPTTRDARLALAGEHPDVREVHRVGASIAAEQVAEIVRQASLAPVEGDRKVLMLHEFHLLDTNGVGRLLKTLEEPPPSTHFIVLADFVPNDVVTIASRCVRVEFTPIPTEILKTQLVIEGNSPASAASAATASGGNLDRARLLVTDPDVATRHQLFVDLPHRLDGTGSAAVSAAADVLAAIEAAAQPLQARQQVELAELAEREKASGTRGSGRSSIETRHKRELRRHRTDELRAGLASVAATYRDALATAPVGSTAVDGQIEAVHRLYEAMEALTNNPNETLLLQSLFWNLPPIVR